IEPFRQVRCTSECAANSAPKDLRHEAGSERVNRLDRLDGVQVVGCRNMVGMNDLHFRIEPLNASAHDALGPDREQLFEIVAASMEINEVEEAGLIRATYPVGMPAAQSRQVPFDRHYQRSDAAGLRFCDFRGEPPVDD